jgi:dihydroneopterin aldolase
LLGEIDGAQVVLGRRPDLDHGHSLFPKQLAAVDRIQLQGMSFQGRHGARASERERPQEFKVDLEVACDLNEPGRTDRLEDTIDYTRLRTITKEVMEGESVNLLETLAARIAERVLDVPRVLAVTVRIAKRPASMQPIEAAAVHINRTRA